MCNKVKAGIACEVCGYEEGSKYPDDWDRPLPCDATEDQIQAHFNELERLEKEVTHHWDCKCLLCR